MVRVAGISFLATLFALGVQALKEPPKGLQIGIKKRIPDEECTKRSHDGDMLTMHYTGTLFDTGEKFDSSLDRNQPFEFTLGTGRVIQGWEQGLKNMCIGEKRRLVIPPHLGYGDRGAGSAIPGGATLVFDVELVNIKEGTRPYDYAQNKQQQLQEKIANYFDLSSPLFLYSTGGLLALLVLCYWLTNKGSSEETKEVKVTETKSEGEKVKKAD
ncbi:uncharacterized protein BYT42DRAFT_563015 [Radiomyces spectabilis]|uniref:uncharacterized protein n=1 Tax=Radiomyces spectabilis TaxID=64574 RepID=UPI00221F0273|nr:uncharacterized protein BYT42DRAFT_563015 [Radiomyces spectabilis]KAI8384590.1 hypothetical protein BYT42DRAFT_563015 [Radiomyces spectabilis]